MAENFMLSETPMLKTFGTQYPKGMYYVYRLVDPRNCNTFYVGKGTGDRVFEHIKCAIKDEDSNNLKYSIIRDIHSAGLEVIHIIHRLGLNERTAYEVEAALIDAYPGLTNRIGGQFNHITINVSDKEMVISKGSRNANELVDILNAKYYDEPSLDSPYYRYIIFKIKKETVDNCACADDPRYEATRKSWQINSKRAKSYRYALSVTDGIVKAVYKIDEDGWCIDSATDGRYYFNGEDVSNDPKIKDLFINKRVPEEYMKKGSQSPFLYHPKK